MKKYDIFITEPAEMDLRDITEYIALERKEPLSACHLTTKIGEAIFELESMPYRHTLVKDERLASQGIRMVLVAHFIIFYVISEGNDSVTIIRVLHGKREWYRLL